jgi:hypothetical protein
VLDKEHKNTYLMAMGNFLSTVPSAGEIWYLAAKLSICLDR